MNPNTPQYLVITLFLAVQNIVDASGTLGAVRKPRLNFNIKTLTTTSSRHVSFFVLGYAAQVILPTANSEPHGRITK